MHARVGIKVINGRIRERWFGVLVVVFILALSMVAFTVLSEIYLTFPLYWFGMIIPIGAVLLTVYLLWSYRLQKGKMKTWVVALSGVLVMSFGALGA